MLGHCAGLQHAAAGDYVLAHGYVREDHVLDEELPLWVLIRPLAEVQLALEQAVADVTQPEGYELKRVMRTGTAASTDNRNWELLPTNASRRSAVLSHRAARWRWTWRAPPSPPTASLPRALRHLLCVSDKPLHGEIAAGHGQHSSTAKQQVDQHLRIGIRAGRAAAPGADWRLHSRKLRSFAEGGVPVPARPVSLSSTVARRPAVVQPPQTPSSGPSPSQGSSGQIVVLAPG